MSSPIINPFSDPKIKIDEASHVYSHEEGGNFISVSNLISEYKRPFDPDGRILAASARKKCITPEVLKKEWEKTKNDASDRGKSFHSQAEHFIKTGQIQEGDYKDVVEELSRIAFKGKLYAETIIYSKKYGLAGTVDLIEDFGNGYVALHDYKTNKKLDLKSPYGKYMLPPIAHLSDCNFIHYTLQLTIYEFILEEMGYWVKDRAILYINPKTRKIEEYKIKSLRDDALRVIKEFNLCRL